MVHSKINRNFLAIRKYLCYLVNTVDLLSRVDHKPTPSTGLHGECLSFSQETFSKNSRSEELVRNVGQNQVSQGSSLVK